jgi:hypothetical protein
MALRKYQIESSYYNLGNNVDYVRCEFSTATERNKVFSGDKPCELCELCSYASEAVSTSITSTLMMEAETVSEALDHNSILTRLIAREVIIIIM